MNWFSEHVTEPLHELIIGGFNALIITTMNGLVDTITGVFCHELELAKSLLENEYIMSAVNYSITIALILLAVRIAFDAFRTYILYSTGQESHPGELLKDAACSTALIISTPWVVKQVLYFCFSITDDIQAIQAVPNIENLGQAALGMASYGLNILIMNILMIVGLVLVLVIIIQIAVRAVNIAILMVIGPWMWAFKYDLGGSWVKALFQQCFAIPIQIFMLRGAFGSLMSTTTQGPLSLLLFIGFLWATLKFPAFLQQLVAQTGVGGAVGGAVKSTGMAVAVRRLAMRR